ncbi:hypothetical protein SAMN04489740_4254 [Arthrobacter alpinus]|uniref:Uncharacterized protein n=1 Tax=Arthrobacter alpinus TaxID=656366 RepID=A0A1H5PFM1_9MICC|nr:hypothetical protein [Arthrobacter alpinus]SEF12530.1 hypothetical protein SAMN04489740_4254 [Arthrobacter alpinus]
MKNRKINYLKRKSIAYSKSVAVIISLGLAFSSSTSATAASAESPGIESKEISMAAPQVPDGGSGTYDERNDRLSAMNMRIDAGRAAGLGWNEIRSDLASFGLQLPAEDPILTSQTITVPAPTTAMPSSAAPTSVNEANSTAAVPNSTAADVDIFVFSIYDSARGIDIFQGQYNWEWQVNKWYPDTSIFCRFEAAPCAMGGEEALGVALSHPLTITAVHGWQRGDVLPNPAEVNQFGAIYKYQDHDYYDPAATLNNGYDATSATVSVETVHSRCGVQAFVKYAHTWSSTGISSLALGASSVGVGFTTTGGSWTAGAYSASTNC